MLSRATRAVFLSILIQKWFFETSRLNFKGGGAHLLRPPLDLPLNLHKVQHSFFSFLLLLLNNIQQLE